MGEGRNKNVSRVGGDKLLKMFLAMSVFQKYMNSLELLRTCLSFYSHFEVQKWSFWPIFWQ